MAFVTSLIRVTDEDSLPEIAQYDSYFLPLNVSTSSKGSFLYLSRDVRKPVFGVSDQVRHKPVCTVTEKLEISDLKRKGVVLSV